MRLYTAAAKKRKKAYGATEPQYLYDLWKRIRGVTGNPNHPKYKDYGGRGVGMYEKWRPDFAGFRSWILENLGERPTEKHSLDRINVNKGYKPGNIQWATLIQQARNQRSNRFIRLNGEKKCLMEWANEYGLDVKLVWMRIFQLGWKPRKALETPPRKFTRKEKAAMLLIRVAKALTAESDPEIALECLCADDMGTSRLSNLTPAQQEQLDTYNDTVEKHEVLERAARSQGIRCNVSSSPDKYSEHSDAYLYFRVSQLDTVLAMLEEVGLPGDIVDVPVDFPKVELTALVKRTGWKVGRQ